MNLLTWIKLDYKNSGKLSLFLTAVKYFIAAELKTLLSVLNL